MTYDVYCIGNALVDMEYVVADTYLQDHGITKGHMTLVDGVRMETLTTALEGVTAQRMCGGSAANTAFAVQAFGGETFYSCRVSGDEIGSYFISEMGAAGVHTNPHDPDMEGKSGRCLILITDDAERSMNAFLGISEELAEDDINLEALQRSRYVYIEGYLASSNTACAAAVLARAAAQEQGVLTSLTLSDPSMVEIFRSALTQMLGNGVHQLFCNDEEALAWAGTDRLDIAVNELKDIAPFVNITLGKSGSLLVSPDGRRQVPGFDVSAIDTTGAGDMYAGACLYMLTHGGSPIDAAKFANYAAAQLVTRVGARLATVESYAALRASFDS
jgi:sugar/nucleoside kinase (ribokinase family)